GGFKFRRQHPKPPFIADFYCAEVKLVLETDGDSHAEREEFGASRTVRLERDGLHVIRFVNDDVHRHLDSVLEEIPGECERLAKQNHPHPNPLPEYRERGPEQTCY
ncbi:MAG TPA: endonuclease domain-containing protein, partial [Tepidisphaeraceae bacterium]|nr:endonuclease domain-containing protein [Tepidisphaeraceae bacterium]